MNQLFKKCTILTFLVLISGCAGLKQKSGEDVANLSPEKEVANLAQARWNALIEKDLAGAYEYLSPGVRSVLSLNAYKAKIHTGSWKKATVDSVSCEKDICKVTLSITYSYRDMNAIETVLFEDWLKENGRWWYAPRK